MESISERNVYPPQDEIAVCAYFIYLSEGCPASREAEHWSQAESQLIADRIHNAVLELTSEDAEPRHTSTAGYGPSP